ncbi:hypothetical protein B0T11DRAFT_139140 [Plectosphaerella cucumerina]|uniref:Uncharacterized protein n=1 Tax=Plectosphaerella cucumerina TaxID=40658 RepID=A0A8K0TA35_9PEZI|nr:hypothetical protein B0T11DRAFT_139140 [Plectosphaerella cucumerina]
MAGAWHLRRPAYTPASDFGADEVSCLRETGDMRLEEKVRVGLKLFGNRLWPARSRQTAPPPLAQSVTIQGGLGGRASRGLGPDEIDRLVTGLRTSFGLSLPPDVQEEGARPRVNHRGGDGRLGRDSDGCRGTCPGLGVCCPSLDHEVSGGKRARRLCRRQANCRAMTCLQPGGWGGLPAGRPLSSPVYSSSSEELRASPSTRSHFVRRRGRSPNAKCAIISTSSRCLCDTSLGRKGVVLKCEIQ